MNQSREAKNKALVLEAFEILFNKRDFTAAEGFWSPDYVQHSAHIAPGRDGLFDLIESLPATLKYQAGMIVAEGDIVIVHGRFSGFRSSRQLDGDGHSADRWRCHGRALGRHPRRSFPRAIAERPTDVRGRIP